MKIVEKEKEINISTINNYGLALAMNKLISHHDDMYSNYSELMNFIFNQIKCKQFEMLKDPDKAISDYVKDYELDGKDLNAFIKLRINYTGIGILSRYTEHMIGIKDCLAFYIKMLNEKQEQADMNLSGLKSSNGYATLYKFKECEYLMESPMSLLSFNKLKNEPWYRLKHFHLYEVKVPYGTLKKLENVGNALTGRIYKIKDKDCDLQMTLIGKVICHSKSNLEFLESEEAKQ